MTSPRNEGQTRASGLPLLTRRLSSASVVTGLLLLAYATAAVLESWIWQSRGLRQFRQDAAASVTSLRAEPLFSPTTRTQPQASIGGKARPKRGQPIAKLEISRLNIKVAVLEGSDDGVLKRGPGHIEDTAYPGEAGNVGIAGHRDTHFRPLRNIRVGDVITLQAADSTLQYSVDSTEIIEPTQMNILDPTPGPALTLVTCFPFDFIGHAPMRFIVHATPRTPENLSKVGL